MQLQSLGWTRDAVVKSSENLPVLKTSDFRGPTIKYKRENKTRGAPAEGRHAAKGRAPPTGYREQAGRRTATVLGKPAHCGP